MGGSRREVRGRPSPPRSERPMPRPSRLVRAAAGCAADAAPEVGMHADGVEDRHRLGPAELPVVDASHQEPGEEPSSSAARDTLMPVSASFCWSFTLKYSPRRRPTTLLSREITASRSSGLRPRINTRSCARVPSYSSSFLPRQAMSWPPSTRRTCPVTCRTAAKPETAPPGPRPRADPEPQGGFVHRPLEDLLGSAAVIAVSIRPGARR